MTPVSKVQARGGLLHYRDFYKVLWNRTDDKQLHRKLNEIHKEKLAHSLLALKVKLQNIADNVPDKDVFNTIASTISALQLYKGLSVEQIIQGDITEVRPLQTLTLADAFAIAQTAFEKDDMFYAIEWLKYIVGEVKDNRISDIDDRVTATAVFHMLSNAYFSASFFLS